MSLFKDYSVKKFKSQKPPADSSFQTAQEIKQLAKTPMNEKFVKEKDDINASFKKTAKKAGVEYPSALVKKLINQSTPFIKELKKAGGTNLRSVSVIDVYDGKGIDESLKSMTFRLFWQATGTTLEDKQVDQFVENQINHAAKIFNAELRS